MAGNFGTKLAKFVGLDEPPTLAAQALQFAELTATRLRWDDSGDGNPTRFERTDGYLVCLQRRGLASMPYWVDGREVRLSPINQGQFLLLNLNEQHSSLVRGSVDCISLYTSREALDRFQEEHELPHIGSLRAEPGTIFEDTLIRNLGECLVPAFIQPEAVSQLFIDHITLAALSHLTAFYGARPASVRVRRGALAPWQENRAKEMLLARIDGKVGLDELARACDLSRSHFARAFKITTGAPPLQWLLAQRIERAKNLLLNSSLRIDQIAQQSGFTDQSHLTRAFLKEVQVTPGLWRRIRRL